jgi:hypothetical protein
MNCPSRAVLVSSRPAGVEGDWQIPGDVIVTMMSKQTLVRQLVM